MTDQDKEEVKAEVKAEAKEKETADQKKAQWLNYLSVTTILIALCATLSTYKGASYSGKSMLSEIKANDQWSLYQSKSIKEYLYEIQIDNLQAELIHSQPGAVGYDNITSRIASYGQNINKYKAAKEQVNKDAKQFELQRDDASKHGSFFGLAVVFLQISILLSSIAALIKKKPVWYFSMVLGLIGILYFVNGFLLFF